MHHFIRMFWEAYAFARVVVLDMYVYLKDDFL